MRRSRRSACNRRSCWSQWRRGGTRSSTTRPRARPSCRQFVFFFQAEDGIRDVAVTGVQTCALPIFVRRAAEVGAWLLADEVYQGAEREGPATASFWGSYERVIVVNGLSKAYGLPGLRIGWVVGPPGFSGEAWARHDYTTIGPAGASGHLPAVALQPRGPGKVVQGTR